MHDDPAAGASPWGNSPGSSPRQTRGFGSSLGDDYQDAEADQTPFGFGVPATAAGLSRETTDELEHGGFGRDGGSEIMAVEHPSGTGGGSGLFTAREGDTGQGHGHNDSQDDVPPETPVKSHDQQRAAELGQQQQQGQGQRQQQQKPAALQFRLHAKITGLERTGKKDPILRFDVHV